MYLEDYNKKKTKLTKQQIYVFKGYCNIKINIDWLAFNLNHMHRHDYPIYYLNEKNVKCNV